MTETKRAVLWAGAGVVICVLLVPEITDMNGAQRYIDFAAFCGIYVGEVVLVLAGTWAAGKLRNRPINRARATSGSCRAMAVAMIAFGAIWLDFSEARPHTLWSEYEYDFHQPAARTDGWHVGTLEGTGLDSVLIERIVERFVNDSDYKWQHSFLMAQDGKLLVEEYFYDKTADTLHDLRSANKSITSILVGVAIDHEIIRSVTDPISVRA